MLIPLYVLIGVWGGAGRIARDVQVRRLHDGRLAADARRDRRLRALAGTFDLSSRARATARGSSSASSLAFAVKAPLFPFHGWLPDAYRESPPEVAAVLSGVISKAGAYGFLRIAIAKFPEPAHDFRMPLLVLAAIGLVYGSLLAFRAPDVRGVIAYSSLAQMGLITLGLFAAQRPRASTAPCCRWSTTASISATLFLLAGMVERRTSTGEFALLGGMARGRPALATVLMTTGIDRARGAGLDARSRASSSSSRASSSSGWVWAVVGAVAIVLAAMYMLRLISAVLHQDLGPAVTDAALDLRPAELGILVPLVALPARAVGVAGGDHASTRFPARPSARVTQLVDGGSSRDRRRRTSTGSRSRPSSSLLGAAGARAARRRSSCRAAVARGRSPRSSPRSASSPRESSPPSSSATSPDARSESSRTRSRATARRARRDHHLRARAARGRSSRTRDQRCATSTSAEYYALLATAGAGMCFFVQAHNLMTLFLGLEWFSIALYVLCAIDIELETSLESGLKYLIVGELRLRDAPVRLRARLRRDGRARVQRDRATRRGRSSDDALLLAGLAMVLVRARLQGLGGAVPHVDAGRLPGRADAGDRVHVGGDEGRPRSS